MRPCAKVRVATLRALRGLMHCGAHETLLDLVVGLNPVQLEPGLVQLQPGLTPCLLSALESTNG